MGRKKVTQEKATEKPVALIIAKKVDESIATGRYSTTTDTWSNRKYDLASSKKHNEDM